MKIPDTNTGMADEKNYRSYLGVLRGTREKYEQRQQAALHVAVDGVNVVNGINGVDGVNGFTKANGVVNGHT